MEILGSSIWDGVLPAAVGGALLALIGGLMAIAFRVLEARLPPAWNKPVVTWSLMGVLGLMIAGAVIYRFFIFKGMPEP